LDTFSLATRERSEISIWFVIPATVKAWDFGASRALAKSKKSL
jgi:hypothetical protein